MARSRRKKLHAADRATVEALAAQSKSKATIAKRLGIGGTTFRDILARDPKVAESYERGKAVEHDAVVESMLEQARKGYFPACRWLLENRHPEYKQTPEDLQRIEIKVVLPQQLTVTEYERLLTVKDVTPTKKVLPERVEVNGA